MVMEAHSKDLLFPTCEILCREVALWQDRYLSSPKLLNPSPFGNLFPGDCFSVDFFFRQSWSIDSAGIVVETLESIR